MRFEVAVDQAGGAEELKVKRQGGYDIERRQRIVRTANLVQRRSRTVLELQLMIFWFRGFDYPDQPGKPQAADQVVFAIDQLEEIES